MKRIASRMGVIQNLGLFDRCIRMLIGILILGGVFWHLQINEMIVSWHGYAMLISVYPLMTGLLGWDPVYQLFGSKTCSLTGRNQCGTLPYQIDAAMGHNPVADNDYDHSMAGSHH